MAWYFAKLWSSIEYLFGTKEPPYYPANASSCRPASLLWPSVRLTLHHGRYPELYGFPQSTTSQKLGYLNLSDPPPAFLSYILGPDWHSRIVIPPDDASNTKENGCSRVNGYSYIPKPDKEEDETEHCLRMKRCGARNIDLGSTMELLNQPIQESERQIFG